MPYFMFEQWMVSMTAFWLKSKKDWMSDTDKQWLDMVGRSPAATVGRKN